MMRRNAFTLVLTLLLLSLLIAASGALSTLGATSAVCAARIANAWEHELAVDSLLECLPELLRAASPSDSEVHARVRSWRFGLSVGRCRLECGARPEAGKFVVHSHDVDAVVSRLRDLARANGLSDASIRPLPLRDDPEARRSSAFVWYDQVIQAADFEEIFRWIPFATEARERVVWSDLITFWQPRSGAAYALDVETAIAEDHRHWHVVVELADDSVRVLHRGAVP